jgi:hypothetical protein
MNSRNLAALTLALTAATGVAQTTYIELPKGYTNNVDQLYDPYLVPSSSYIPEHLQYAYDTADLGIPVANFVELAWHRNNYWANALPAGSITTTVTMSLSPNAPSAMSTTFASNMVSLTKQVYQGTVNWPVATKGTGPAPWTHVLPLTTPFLCVVGTNKSLVIDVVTTATTYAASTYTIAASAPDAGTRVNNGNAQSLCKFSNGNYNNTLSYTTGGLNNNGGIWYLQYGSLLPNAPGIATLSAYGLDFTGPWPLPINLTGLGAPNCAWHVGLELGLWVPVPANASGTARWPNLTIPAGLGGLSFYDHALFLDPAANKAGWVTTWSSKWYIGTGVGPSANTVYKIQDTASSPTGTLRTGYGTHVRLGR